MYKLALVNHPLNNTWLCQDCTPKQLEARKVEHPTKRVERRLQRPAELRNRKGRCPLSCLWHRNDGGTGHYIACS